MSFLKDALDFLGGGVFKTISDRVKDYFPPSMSDAEKAELQLKISQIEHEREMQLKEHLFKADQEFNNRIKEMEGTAKDLLAMPILGRFILFLRGLQRPLFGFAVFYWDWMVFSGDWVIADNSKTELTFFIVNILVLGFLFGERAVQNVLPIANQFLQNYRQKKGKE